MSGVPNQGHFYCKASYFDSCWFIFERSCKKFKICGGFIGLCKTRYRAYKLRNMLEKMYRLRAFDKLARFRLEFASRYLFESDVYYYALSYARQLLLEVFPDDSQVISAPIISNGV